MAESSLNQHLVTTLPSARARPVSTPRPRHARALRRARAIAEGLFSTDETPPSAERLGWLMAELESVLAHAGSRSARFYKLALFVVTFLAPLFVLKPVPLHRLSVRDRVRALERMEHSFAGSVVLAVKAILCLIYYEHAGVARDLGYSPGRHWVTP